MGKSELELLVLGYKLGVRDAFVAVRRMVATTPGVNEEKLFELLGEGTLEELKAEIAESKSPDLNNGEGGE